MKYLSISEADAGLVAVTSAMKDTDIMHFTCHGSSDPVNLSRSHLLLQRCKSSTLAVEKLTCNTYLTVSLAAHVLPISRRVQQPK